MARSTIARGALALMLTLIGVLGVWASLKVRWVPDLAPELSRELLRLRVYRLVAAALVGAALSMAGVLVQGLFRNPLAGPSILGSTAGASLGGMLAMLAGYALFEGGPWAQLGELGVPLGCCLGAAGALLVLLFGVGRSPGTVGLLLAGVVLSSLLGSVSALMVSLASQHSELGRALMSFGLGGLEGVGWRHLVLATPLVMVGGLMAFRFSTSLDLLLTGETEARALGLDLKLTVRWVVIWVSVLTAGAVALGGNLMFVGLVVPHALRPYVGVRHGPLLAFSAATGAVFVIWADLVTRTLPPSVDLPLGVVTSLVGAPVFLLLLVRRHRQRGWM